jgi:signal transduction histidine kinase
MVRALRTHPELDGVPVLMLTLLNEDVLRVKLLREGAQDYVVKPCSVEELQARVANLLKTKRSPEALQRKVAQRQPAEASGSALREQAQAIRERAVQARAALAVARLDLKRRIEQFRKSYWERQQTRARLAPAETGRQQERQRMEAAREEERRRVAWELQNRTGQSLVVFLLALKSLAAQAEDSAEGRERLGELQALARQIAQELIAVAGELYPTSLENLGLAAALEGYLDEWSASTGVAATFHSALPESPPLSLGVGTALYRIVQEALTNVARHAHARQVSLVLQQRAGHVLLILEDDGQGFDAEAVMHDGFSERRTGLREMQERAAWPGGTVTIESTPGQGTTVFVRLPLGASGEAIPGHGENSDTSSGTT